MHGEPLAGCCRSSLPPLPLPLPVPMPAGSWEDQARQRGRSLLPTRRATRVPRMKRPAVFAAGALARVAVHAHVEVVVVGMAARLAHHA